MATLGSVFLGDLQRHRVLSSPPPSSPPLAGSFNQNAMSIAAASSEHPEGVPESPDGTESPAKASPSPTAQRDPSHLPVIDHAPTTIDPVLSLELRLRWLEALLLGVRQDTRDRKAREKPPELKHGESLVRLAGDVQRRLNAVVESNDGLKKFMHQCTSVASRQALWRPRVMADPADAPRMQTTSTHTCSRLRLCSLGRSRGPRRRMRTCRQTSWRPCFRKWNPTCVPPIVICARSSCSNKRGCCQQANSRVHAFFFSRVLLRWGTADERGSDYEALQPRLHALLAAQEQDMRLAASLERRIATLVERHATHVSHLFFHVICTYLISL